MDDYTISASWYHTFYLSTNLWLEPHGEPPAGRFTPLLRSVAKQGAALVPRRLFKKAGEKFIGLGAAECPCCQYAARDRARRFAHKSGLSFKVCVPRGAPQDKSLLTGKTLGVRNTSRGTLPSPAKDIGQSGHRPRRI